MKKYKFKMKTKDGDIFNVSVLCSNITTAITFVLKSLNLEEESICSIKIKEKQ